MKKLFFIIGLVGLVSLSVSGQKKRELTTQVSVDYTLPKISYDVVVTMECSRLIPGPFRQYAEQQLGVSPEITSEGEEWMIKKIQFVPRALPDPKAMYTVNASGEYNSILLNITPDGFLAGVGSGTTNQTRNEDIIYEEVKNNSESGINYVRFGIRSTQKEVLDSNFTEMEVEGEIRKVWDPIERQVLKESEDYVKEITEDIFAIRKKRLDMLAAGTATAEALKAMDKFEANYMSLFMGKKETREVVQTFSYVPEKADESVVLFRFSANDGITAKNNVSAIPYIVELKNIYVPKKEAAQAGNSRPVPSLSYREPAVADLCLLKGKENVMTVRCVIPQLGFIKQFPLDVINNEGISIDFYPQYGSLKSIMKK